MQYKKSHHLVAIVFLLTLLCVSPAQAEDPARGRLADGRAFRTDSSGNEIVDYIAELELEVDALKRQVHGLEFELEQKGSAEERAHRGASPVIKESTIVGQPSSISENTAAQRQHYEAEISALKRKLNEQSVESGNASTEALRKHVSDLTNALDDRDNQIALLKSRNEVGSSSETLQLETLIKKNRELETSLNQKTELAEALEKKYEVDRKVFERKVALLEEKANALQNSVHARESSPASSAAQIADMQRLPSLQSRAAPQPADTSRGRALDSIKGRLFTNINRVKGLFATRERVFNQYKAQGRKITFRITPPVSRAGHSLGDLSELIRGSSNILELSSFHREVLEIESRLKDDIALIERLSRVR